MKMPSQKINNANNNHYFVRKEFWRETQFSGSRETRLTAVIKIQLKPAIPWF